MSTYRAFSDGQLADRINQAHHVCSRMMQTSLEQARECGEMLREAKARAGHGRWLAWVAANLRFGDRQARHYLAIAERWGELAPHAALGITPREARRILAGDAAEGDEDEAKSEPGSDLADESVLDFEDGEDADDEEEAGEEEPAATTADEVEAEEEAGAAEYEADKDEKVSEEWLRRAERLADKLRVAAKLCRALDIGVEDACERFRKALLAEQEETRKRQAKRAG